MVDWQFSSFFHYLMHCIFPVVFTPTSHVHIHNSTWLMVSGYIEILGLTKPCIQYTDIKFTIKSTALAILYTDVPGET